MLPAGGNVAHACQRVRCSEARRIEEPRRYPHLPTDHATAEQESFFPSPSPPMTSSLTLFPPGPLPACMWRRGNPRHQWLGSCRRRQRLLQHSRMLGCRLLEWLVVVVVVVVMMMMVGWCRRKIGGMLLEHLGRLGFVVYVGRCVPPLP